MPSSLRPLLRRKTTMAAAGAAVLLAIGGGTTAAVAAGADSAPSASASTACSAPHLRALLHGGTPSALRTDLQHLRSEPKGQRAAERKAIRQKALSGAYGQGVERVAHLFGKGAKGHAWLQSLPAALQTDLKALRALPAKGDTRTAKAQDIASKALSGAYGSAVQTTAQAAEHRIQARCTAKQ